jgi:hypothetical protein
MFADIIQSGTYFSGNYFRELSVRAVRLPEHGFGSFVRTVRSSVRAVRSSVRAVGSSVRAVRSSVRAVRTCKIFKISLFFNKSLTFNL